MKTETQNRKGLSCFAFFSLCCSSLRAPLMLTRASAKTDAAKRRRKRRPAWALATWAAATVIATTPASAVTWTLDGSTSTTTAAPRTADPSGEPSATSATASPSGDLSGESRAAYFADRYVSLGACQKAARLGNLAPGRKVLVCVGQSPAKTHSWYRSANLKGWTFCTADESLDLPAGVHRCEVRDDGKIYPQREAAPDAYHAANVVAASSAPSMTQAEPTWLNWQPQPRVIYTHDVPETTYLPTYQPYSQPWQGGSYYTGGGFGGVFSGGACAGGSCSGGSCR